MVTREGFEPKRIVVRAGETVTFVITRRVARTCVKRVIIELDGKTRIERELPMGKPVAITFRFEAKGELGMYCPMRMYGVAIDIR